MTTASTEWSIAARLICHLNFQPNYVGWQKLNERKIAVTVEVAMNFTIEHEREDDGRWLAEVPELSGVLAYGATAKEAMAKAEALALRVLAERLEHNETGPQSISIAVA